MQVPLVQYNAHTHYNRYYKVWEYLQANYNPSRILSFGCSTGEECVTAQAYFPDAEVTGYDINPIFMRIGAVRFPSIKFNAPYGKYDLVLCNSVLCKHPENNHKEQNNSFPFSEFKEAVTTLDSYLHEKGLMMLMNTEYQLNDALPYLPVGPMYHFEVSQFDKDGRLKKNKRNYAIWRKP